MRLADFSQKYGDFYVPAFAVRVAGKDLIRELFVAVTQTEVSLVLGAMSRFSFTVANAFDMDRREFLDADGKDLLETLAFGAEVEVAAGYGDTAGLSVLISGVITEVGTNFADGGTPELTIAGYDHSYPMSVGKNSASWAQRRDSDVAADIAGFHNLDTDVTPTKVQHPQIEQNQECDLEFIKKLADRNERYKVYVTGETLHFGPARDKQEPVVTLPYGAGLLSFKPEANLAGQVEKVELVGWDTARKQAIIGRAQRGDEPGRDARRQSAADYLQGVLRDTPTLRLRRGRDARPAGDTARHHGGARGDRAPVLQGLLRRRGNASHRWQRLPHALQSEGDDTVNALATAPQPESTHESGGYLKGVAIAVVTQNRDPDGLGRVKLKFSWESEPRESDWARCAVPMAGKDRGTYFLPEVGDEVLVAFEREDMRFPYVLGALWNGQDAPPDNNSDGKNDRRVIKSRKGHTLTFDDQEQGGSVELRLQDGKHLKIDDQGLVLEDGKGNKVSIQSSGAISIEATQSLTLKAPSITLDASATAELKAGATMTVRGGLVQIN
jgi:phage protein D/phage baseplate assembly protein gpV